MIVVFIYMACMLYIGMALLFLTYNAMVKKMKMKKKSYWIALVLVLSLFVSSFLLSHLLHIDAHKNYQPLAGVCIVLDAGHGLPDAGAQSGDAKEEEINLSIVTKLETILKEKGAVVKLTRSDHHDLASEDAANRKREDMKKRIDLINEEQTDLFISVHLNAYPNASVKGAQAFYEKNNEVSKVFADIIQKHLKQLTDTKMTSKTGDYYLLNNSHKVGSLVECGFLSNAEDREKLLTQDYQQQIAQTLYESIQEYFQMLS